MNLGPLWPNDGAMRNPKRPGGASRDVKTLISKVRIFNLDALHVFALGEWKVVAETKRLLCID